MKQMMPVRPSALAAETIGLIARENRHGRDESFLLPFRESRAKQIEDAFLAFEVLDRYAAVHPIAAWRHPPHAVETLLKDVVRTRHEVVVFPKAQTLRPAQTRDAITVARLGAHRVAVLHGAHVGLFYLGIRGTASDMDVILCSRAIRRKLRYGSGPLADNPAWREGNPFAGGRALRFDTVEVGIGAVAVAVMLYSHSVI